MKDDLADHQVNSAHLSGFDDARAYAEQIIDALHEPLMVLDGSAVIRSINRSFSDQFHLDPGRIEGRSIVDLAVEEWKIPESCSLYHQIVDLGRSSLGYELKHTFPSIGRRVMLLNARPMMMKAGQPEFVLLSILDITERTRAEEAIKLANRKLNLLNSVTRHDILNQLTVILGYLEILDGTGFSKNSHEYLSRIETASTAIKKQIQFTAEYQDIGASAPRWHHVRDVVHRAGNCLSRFGVQLRIELDDPLDVYADALLERVFTNLFENSLIHGVTVSEIIVSGVPCDEGLVIVVEDNGEGIPEALKEKIFSMGCGLRSGYGLFLVREILDMTGISIRETGRPGGGARFEISVPRESCRFPQG